MVTENHDGVERSVGWQPVLIASRAFIRRAELEEGWALRASNHDVRNSFRHFRTAYYRSNSVKAGAKAQNAGVVIYVVYGMIVQLQLLASSLVRLPKD